LQPVGGIHLDPPVQVGCGSRQGLADPVGLVPVRGPDGDVFRAQEAPFWVAFAGSGDRVRCPVLLIQGDVDTDVVPEYSHTAHKILPDSTLVIMERGTHLAFYAHPQASDVQEQARGWLGEHS
jgi:pimeloyl-ACP methyl ester carboxylesterase